VPRRVVFLALLVAAALGVAAGCSSDDKETLRIYTGRHYGAETAFERFAKDTGISIDFLSGTDAELRERIKAEGEDTQADIYLTVDAGNLAVAAKEGLFQPLDSDVLRTAIPASLRDPEDRWFGLSVRARSIVYNVNAVPESELPTTYEALSDRKWDGRLCLRDSTNVYTQSLVASLIAHDGRDKALEVVKGWARNARILNNDVSILDSIAKGQCDIGITNHYYLAREYEEDPNYPVKMTWVEQGPGGRGVHVNISGAGVTKYADDPDLARRFLEWMATEGQELFAGENHEIPVSPDARPDGILRTHFTLDFKRDDLNAATFGGLNPDAVRLMDEAGYD
jgi:iron(III) transport system substrate-binding protein